MLLHLLGQRRRLLLAHGHGVIHQIAIGRKPHIIPTHGIAHREIAGGRQLFGGGGGQIIYVVAAIAGADDALIYHHALCFFVADFKALFVSVFFGSDDIAEHLLQGRQLRFALLGFGQLGHKQGRGSRAACIPASEYRAVELCQVQGIGGSGQFFGLGIEAVPFYGGVGTKSGIVWHVGKQIRAIPFVVGQQAGFECDGLLPCIAIKFKTAALKAAHEILVG